MTNKALALYKETLTPATRQSLDAIKANFGILQAAMDSVLISDLHYGVIPGTGQKKPVLLKPGADVLCSLFRMVPDYDVTFVDLGNDHREYTVKCFLATLEGVKVSQGLGLCTTKEKKYRYRSGGGEVTNIGIPKRYWDLRDSEPLEANALLKDLANKAGIEGDKFGVKKNEEGQWRISTFGEKVENDCIADTHNTCLKMAKKRALVDAVLTATGAEISFSSEARDFKGDIIDADFEEMAFDSPEPEPETPEPEKIDVEGFFEELAVKCGLTTAEEKKTLRYYLKKTCETTGYDLGTLLQTAVNNLDGFTKKYTKWLKDNQSKEPSGSSKNESSQAEDKSKPGPAPEETPTAQEEKDKAEALTLIEKELKWLGTPGRLPLKIAEKYETNNPADLTLKECSQVLMDLKAMNT
jgi:hypothetical protein